MHVEENFGTAHSHLVLKVMYSDNMEAKELKEVYESLSILQKTVIAAKTKIENRLKEQP